MKKNILLGILVAGILLVNGKVSIANAETLSGQSKQTQIKIVITGDENESADKIESSDQDNQSKKALSLEGVPDNYDFKSSLLNGEYNLDASLNDTSVDVFNNYIDHEWIVKAGVEDNKLALTRNENKTLEINSFKINDKEVLKVGADGIIAKAANNKTAENNTGVNKASINNLFMSFSDTKNILKENDELNGKINYKLYNIPDAK